MSIPHGLCYMLLLNASLGICHVFVGFGNNLLAPFIMTFANQSFHDQFNVALDEEQLGLLFGALTSSDSIGSICGLFFFSKILDSFGRRNTVFIFGNALLIPSGFLMAVSKALNAWEAYLVGRVLCGFCTIIFEGGIAILVGEAVPNRIRGACIIFVTCGKFVWVLFSNSMALPQVFGNDEIWNYYFLVPVPFMFAHFILGLTIHESPKFLYNHKNDLIGAENALRFYQGSHVDIDAQFQHYDNEAALTEMENATKLSTILNTSYLRKALLLCICLASFPAYTGEVLVRAYLNILLQELDFDQYSSILVISGMSICSLLLIILASIFLIEKVKRRTLIFAIHFISLVMTASLCISFQTGDSKNVISTLSLGISMISIVLLASVGAPCIGNIFCTELTPQMVNLASHLLSLPSSHGVEGYVFLIFTIAIIPFMLCYYFSLPESRNRPPDEIVADMAMEQHQEEEEAESLCNSGSHKSYESIGERENDIKLDKK